jgi:phosphoribosylformylglycinamidine (FGAM) synthase-like enzyme
MIGKSVLVIAGIIVILAIAIGLYASGIEEQLLDVGGGGISANMAEVVIRSDSGWSADIRDSQSRSHVVEGFGDRTLPITCNNDSTYSLTVKKTDAESGALNVKVQTGGNSSSSSQRSTTTSSNGVISLSGTC